MSPARNPTLGADGAARFVREHTEPARPSLVPELALRLANLLDPLWQGTEDALAQDDVPPPYWGFAWAGGQGLARYVMDHPGCVAGQGVLDFATGSGLVAIAAAKAGAAPVFACDIDPFAIEAVTMNAALNAVTICPVLGDLVGKPLSGHPELQAVGVILAGDVFYERELAGPLLDWLVNEASGGRQVLIGDPGRYYLPRQGLELQAEYTAPTTTEIEDADVKRTRVWRIRP